MGPHEVRCFMERTELSRDAFKVWNMTCQSLGPASLEGAAAVMIGGSGDFSVVQGGFDWHEPMLGLLREVVRRKLPTFASCFGHQALAQSLGGVLVRDPARGELGTHPVTLTADGQRDPLFGQLPTVFTANFGHTDQVVSLPPEMEHLAATELCPIQATRVRGTQIVSTQFHPELTWQDNLDRWLAYLRNYRAEGESLEEAEARARAGCHASPHSLTLLPRFVEQVGLRDL